jgi:hypothetical protein
MIISSVTGVNTPVQVKADMAPKVETVDPIKKITYKDVDNMMSTEEYVREYFADLPIMINIARCESHFRQLDKDGSIHRGVVNSADVGVMQINEYYHLDEATANNYNIYTLEGNTAYARKLYEREGTQPWSSSKACWGKSENSNDSSLAVNMK